MDVGDRAPAAAIARRKSSHRDAPVIVLDPVAPLYSSRADLCLLLVDDVHSPLVPYVRWYMKATALVQALVGSAGAILARERWTPATSARMCATERRDVHVMSLFSGPPPTYAFRSAVQRPTVLVGQLVLLRPPPSDQAAH